MDLYHVKQFDRSKADSAGPNPGRKVRVVAKVRGFAFPEVEAQGGSLRSVDWISVNKPPGESSEGVAISFRDNSSRFGGKQIHASEDDGSVDHTAIRDYEGDAMRLDQFDAELEAD